MSPDLKPGRQIAPEENWSPHDIQGALRRFRDIMTGFKPEEISTQTDLMHPLTELTPTIAMIIKHFGKPNRFGDISIRTHSRDSKYIFSAGAKDNAISFYRFQDESLTSFGLSFDLPSGADMVRINGGVVLNKGIYRIGPNGEDSGARPAADGIQSLMETFSSQPDIKRATLTKFR